MGGWNARSRNSDLDESRDVTRLETIAHSGLKPFDIWDPNGVLNRDHGGFKFDDQY